MSLFSPEDLATQVGAIELIMAMWQGDGELHMDDTDMRAVTALAEYLNLPVQQLGDHRSTELKDSLPSAIAMTLTLHPENGADSPVQGWEQRKLKLDVSLPLRKPSGTRPTLRVRNPEWMRRALFDQVTQAIEQNGDEEDEDPVGIIMGAVERLSEVVLAHAPSLPEEHSSTSEPETALSSEGNKGAQVLRTWSYLPSLSSKEKRADMVHYASSHRPPLTGFVLAGKPGLVLLEHPLHSHTLQQATASIDTFWSKIKSESWADIPSGHKKVSEKYREEDVVGVFSDFQEMTEREEVGGKEVVAYGGKRNKSDLASLQVWLDGLGLPGRLERVLGAEWQ